MGQWRADLADIATVLVDSDAAALLANGRTPIERRLAFVERMLDIQPLALNLARLLITKGRTADAAAVAEAFNRMADEDAGIEHAAITTAVELPPDQLVKIEQQLSTAFGKEVHATASVDPGLVGGGVVRVGD